MQTATEFKCAKFAQKLLDSNIDNEKILETILLFKDSFSIVSQVEVVDYIKKIFLNKRIEIQNEIKELKPDVNFSIEGNKKQLVECLLQVYKCDTIILILEEYKETIKQNVIKSDPTNIKNKAYQLKK